MVSKITPCGGCGAWLADDRCIGCLHDFGGGMMDEPLHETRPPYHPLIAADRLEEEGYVDEARVMRELVAELARVMEKLRMSEMVALMNNLGSQLPMVTSLPKPSEWRRWSDESIFADPRVFISPNSLDVG